MIARKTKKSAKQPTNVIVGAYPLKQEITIEDYIRDYGLKVSDLKKRAKKLGIPLCLKKP